MIPKLKLNLENWKPELRENLKKTLDIDMRGEEIGDMNGKRGQTLDSL